MRELVGNYKERKNKNPTRILIFISISELFGIFRNPR